MPKTLILRLIPTLAVLAMIFSLTQNSMANNISPFEIIRSTDFVMAGTGGMRGVGTGSFAVSGISGVITKAYLYWHGPTDSSNRDANAIVTLNGKTVVGQNIGLSNDNCWGFANSHAYRAEVTTIVEATGNGMYTLSNFMKPNRIDINGVALIVFYYDEDFTNDRDVVIFDGNDSNIQNSYDELGWNVSLTRIEYVSGTSNMHLVVGDGQDWLDDALKVNSTVAIPRGQIFRGDLGPRTHFGSLWDIKRIDVTPYLTSGLNTLSLTTGTYSDCLSLVVAVVDLPAGATPCNVGESTLTSNLSWTESCAPEDRKKIKLKWSGSGEYKDILESDIGEKLELECYGSYELWYTSPKGQKNRVGKCPFYGGCNSAYFTYSGDKDNNGKPDCFGRIFWKSKDYYSNDIPNSWTGEQNENPPRFDIAVTIFDAATNFLTKKSFKHAYGFGETFWPLWPHDCDSYRMHELLDVFEKDPVVGPETERFFDRVNEAFKNLRSSDPPMTGSQTSLADLNRDGIEDSFDLQIIQQALDTCRGEENFSPEADLDFNGCVTSVDYKMFTDVFNTPKTLPGDLDNDGLINTADYQVFRTTLGKCTGTTGFIAEADYDGDGCITYADYKIWYGYYKNQ